MAVVPSAVKQNIHPGAVIVWNNRFERKNQYKYTKFTLAFLSCLNYNMLNQYVQRLLYRKDGGQVLELNKGMGSKSPHLTNTVGIEKQIRWRKPVIRAT